MIHENIYTDKKSVFMKQKPFFSVAYTLEDVLPFILRTDFFQQISTFQFENLVLGKKNEKRRFISAMIKQRKKKLSPIDF